MKQKKKDDIADTVMQALSYSEPQATKKSIKKKTPRRPTPNQTETRYSRANLAWLYNHGIPDNVKKRFEKDLKRYYRDVQEMLSDFNINGE
jgi:hypothetical protein